MSCYAVRSGWCAANEAFARVIVVGDYRVYELLFDN
jgi:hypothetical protein